MRDFPDNSFRSDASIQRDEGRRHGRQQMLERVAADEPAQRQEIPGRA